MTQPKIEGTGHGKPVMVFGSDGSDHYEQAVDSDGHPQVDVLTVPYPGLGSLETKEKTGALASSATWTEVLSTTGPGILEGLNFATNYESSEVSVTVDQYSLVLPQAAGLYNVDVAPDDLHTVNGETQFWKEGVYDDVAGTFTIFLKRAIHYKNTLVVKIRQESGVNKNILCRVSYRLLA